MNRQVQYKKESAIEKEIREQYLLNKAKEKAELSVVNKIAHEIIDILLDRTNKISISKSNSGSIYVYFGKNIVRISNHLIEEVNYTCQIIIKESSEIEAKLSEFTHWFYDPYRC
jgi:hypothetical protein